MPTPSIYVRSDLDPWTDVPPHLRSDRVPVLFVTDRAPDADEKGQTPDRRRYGSHRSRSAAYGVCEMQIGEGLTWDELVRASRSPAREDKLHVSVASTRELGRFPPTPPRLVLSDADLAQTRPTADPAEEEVGKQFVAELTDRLAGAGRKDVYLYVHGFGNTLEEGVMTIGQLWHFMGRPGVAVAYSWPAGVGRLRAYNYTRESGEFTIYHLKQTLRRIASCPSVERIHVIAHSRGTDVASTAIRELHLETAPTGDSQKILKLGTLVLAAADLDMDVVIQRLAAERIGRACQRIAVYVCSRDKVLSVSNWLFGGAMRAGEITASVFAPEELEILKNSWRVQIIDARVADPGSTGHSYFYSNPAVSSDLVLLLRYELAPGGQYGRPLTSSPNGLWTIDDNYPAAKDWIYAIRRHVPAAEQTGADGRP